MEGQSGLSELSVISWVSAVEGCPLSGHPLYNNSTTVSQSIMTKILRIQVLVIVLAEDIISGIPPLFCHKDSI